MPGLEMPGVPPPIVAAPNQNLTIPLPGQSWTAATGPSYSINSNGQLVNPDGTVDIRASGVDVIGYDGKLIWLKTASNVWYSEAGPNGTLTQYQGVGAPPGLWAGPYVPGTLDTELNIWTITANHQIMVDGVVDQTTSNVVQLFAPPSGGIWQETTAGLWSFKSTPSSAWSVAAATPPSNPPSINAPEMVLVRVGQSPLVGGISISEAPTTAGETFTAVLADTNGVLSAKNLGVGGGGTITPSNGGKTLTITGTLAQVNADLLTLTDNDGSTAADTITVNAHDSNGGSATAASIAVTVNGVLGNGSFTVGLSGSNNVVTIGNGNSKVSGGQDANVIVIGNGNSSVSLSGSDNSVTIGIGNGIVTLGGGDNTVSLGNGNDTITLAGSGSTVTLGNGIDTVHGGTGDTIHLAATTLTLYGTNEMVFIGNGNATVNDFSTGLDLKIGPTAGVDVLAHFASDPSGVVDLIGGIGGFATTAAVLSALKSDGHGGTLLSFGSGSSLDFTVVAPSHLHASNFQIG